MHANPRPYHQMRPIQIHRHYTQHAEGSTLIIVGQTQVLCTASVEAGVPRFLQGKNQGWVTAEYGMLPRSTGTRMPREAARGKQSGRTLEIQRLIGRSLRAAVDLNQLAGYTITVDCDVLQADGGTRTAAITGAMVALVDALRHLQRQKLLATDPLKELVAAVSVGLYQQQPVLDLDYQQDSQADTDMNVVMNARGEFIEIQGTAEKTSFSDAQLLAMLSLAKQGIAQLIEQQEAALRTD